MEITLKPKAIEELKKTHFEENEGLRIEAIFIGSCAVYVEYHLRIDIKKPDDELYLLEGIPVLVSEESRKYLYHRITLDFNPQLGFKLSSDEETYRYDLNIVR
ncbi:iron-sulfur cluster biosynthesis family protein [Bacillus massiliglaciei]|uniref:iron-sulfur cluster biosynthesis family protein n=1 Tax=Bacillus massiliglaciei TaxID=1816693 RepID=UPI000DA6169A|nr:iron-sulfur cluster biosynthesis family protein [Bacillus massiliglaciei]